MAEGRGKRLLGLKLLESIKSFSWVLIVIFIVSLLLVRNSHTLIRVMADQEIDIKTIGFNEIQTDHFRIKYLPIDEGYINLVVDTAEHAYTSVSSIFGQEPKTRTTIIVYPDNQSLAESFGWDKDEKAMGVYWAGSIRILSPRVWLAGANRGEQFFKEGPVHHEFAHLMVDEITKGNYNRWWTEGIAQYVEKKITGFEFADPFEHKKARFYYPLSTLQKKFDSLDQQIAYWQSLKAVEFIADQYGEKSIFEILANLAEGSNLNNAFIKVLGIDLEQFEDKFYNELQKHNKRCMC